MSPTRIIVTLLAGVLCLCAGSQQTSEGSGSELFGNLSSKNLDAVSASRNAAQQELASKAADFEDPDITSALLFGDRGWLTAIAKITSVQLPTNANGSTKIAFHVEQVLDGKSQLSHFNVESRWNPQKVKEAGPLYFEDPNYTETVLDKTEPKVGNRYILGYSLQDYDIDRSVYVTGVVDLQDPAQAALVASVRRFLKLDAEAAVRGDEAYLEMLDDKLSWFRGIAVSRLADSDTCYRSRQCAERFQARLKREFYSAIPNEREQAIGWLVWSTTAVSVNKNLIPATMAIALLSEAVKDRNVELGDIAFEGLERFEAYRTGSPGDCYEIVPTLRRAVHWHSVHPEVRNEHVSYEYGCIPPK